MAWRVARSLDTLLAQLNAIAPRRSKVSDGSIGDAAHASRSSDHNPWLSLNGTGIVTARDYTHDLKGGLDCNWLAKVLTASGDKRIKYVIWNRRIWDPRNGWQAYKGINPHDHHLHLSVVSVPSGYDSTAQWQLGNSAAVGSPITTLPVQEDDDMTPDQAAQLNRIELLLSGGLKGVRSEGDIVRRLRELQATAQIAADAVTPGVDGSKVAGATWAAATAAASAAGASATEIATAIRPLLLEIVEEGLAEDRGATADEIVDRFVARLAS